MGQPLLHIDECSLIVIPEAALVRTEVEAHRPRGAARVVTARHANTKSVVVMVTASGRPGRIAHTNTSDTTDVGARMLVGVRHYITQVAQVKPTPLL